MITKFTKGGWHACGDGDCECKHVWSAHHPITSVEHGEWGDTYPAIRVVGEGVARLYEPYIEKIPYGFIPEEVAVANAQVIAKATASYEQMIAITHFGWRVWQAGAVADGPLCEWCWETHAGEVYREIGPKFDTPPWPEEARQFIENWLESLENNAENA